MPYRPPPPPAPKRKQAPSPEDVHQGRHKPPHPAPKPRPAPSPEDVHQGQHAPPHPPAPPAWVTQRQRALRAAGFHVRVDGVWGPRSQYYWAQYQLGKRPGAGRVPEFREPKLSPAREQQLAVVRRLRSIRPEVQAGVSEMRAHVEKALAASQAVRLPDGRAAGTTLRAETTDAALIQVRRQARAFAAKARATPPEKMSLDQVVALTVDPLTGHLNPTRPADVRRVQNWLRVHGHPRLKADGTWGPETFNALRSSYFAALRSERRHQVHKLVSTMYDTGVVRPGETIPGFGRVPAPGALLDELQAGGFAAALQWKRLTARARARGVEYLAAREAKLVELDKQAFGGIAPPALLTSDVDRYLRLAAFPSVSRSAADQIGALAASKGFKELRHRLLDLRRIEKQLHQQQLEAAKHRSWWQGTLDYAVVKPLDFAFARGEEFRHAAGIPIGAFSALLHGTALDPRRGGGRTPDEETRRLDDWMKKNHPWIRLGLNLAVDPINLVPGFGAIGRFGVASGLALERFGYAVARGGEFVPLAGLRPVSKVGLGLTLPAKGGRAVRAAALLADEGLRGSRPGYVALRYAAEKATRLKSEAVMSARRSVNAAMRHGFRPPKALPDGLDALHDFPLDGSTLADVDLALDNVTPHVQRAVTTVLDSLHAAEGSLWSDLTYATDTGLGAMLKGRVAEVFRIAVLRQMAVEQALAAHSERYGELVDALGEHVDAVGKHEAKVHADAHAKETYWQVINKGGSWVQGLADSELGDELLRRTRQLLDRFEWVFMPVMQRELERRAALAERELFDAAGKWAGRDSLVAESMRKLGAEAFDEENLVERVNPNHGQVFNVLERNSMVEQEQSRRVGSYLAWAHRVAAAGDARPKEVIDQHVRKLLREVESAWEPVEGGGFRDTRPKLHVPRIYARDIASLIPREADDLLLPEQREVVGHLKALVDEPSSTAVLDDPIQAELEQLAWSIGYGHDLDERVFRFGDPGLGLYRPTDKKAWADAKALRAAVNEAVGALARGYAEALPKALRSEWALYQALAEAQGSVARVVYRAISGPLSVWQFSVLALRGGWVVRNVIDNQVKSFIEGLRNPLVWGGVGHPTESFLRVFESDLRATREIAAKFDGVFHTDVSGWLNHLFGQVWNFDTEVLGRIFKLHGIPVPEKALAEIQMNPFEHFGQRVPRPFSSEEDAVARGRLTRGAARAHASYRSFRENAFELMGNRPENYFKRALYRTTLERAKARGLDEVSAHNLAWGKVEKTLFDYSKISVIEHNLLPLLPFIQFWRKNTGFWLKTFASKPWLPADIDRYETQLRDDIHADLPDWMRRYLHTDEVGNGLGQIPGLGWLAEQVLPDGVMSDPMNLLSLAPMYRAFKGSNPLLPADKAGLPFVSGFVDALNDWGLSMNPLLRKPLELGGVLNYRAWQSVFPGTPLIEVATMHFWHDQFPHGLNVEALLEDPLAQALTGEGSLDRISENFDYWVQIEMAGQQARGERVDRAAAEAKIRSYFALQALVGYFGGIYFRRANPQDTWLYKLSDDFHKQRLDYLKLSPREQQAYQLFKRRGLDPVEFDRYASAIPLIQAYYAQHSFKAGERFKAEHPEILPWVEPVWAGRDVEKASAVGTMALSQNGDFAMRMLDLASELRLPNDVRKTAEAALVTPELRAFWAKNDTPAELRDRHLKLAFFRYVERLNETYFAIPEDHFDARAGFLEQHPVLAHWWMQNNSESDDFKAIINSTSAALRDLYFEKVDTEGFDQAASFLHRYPFIFEFTKASKKVDPLTGEWIGGGGRGGGSHGLSQHARDYLAAKASLDAFFALPESQRSAWLESGSPAARQVRSYFAKYAHFHGGRGRTLTQHARDYLRAKPYLEKFFDVLKKRGEDDAWLYLHGDANTKAAAIVLAYFRKYAHPEGTSQHARDFLKAKKQLDFYFGLSKGARSKWLHGGSKDAEVVLAFFKRYGRIARIERIFRKEGLLSSSRPELNQRLKFWQRLWTLSPEDRPGFILRHAADYGVFVYGPLNAERGFRREQEFLRKALLMGVGEKAAMQVYVKPLMDFFFTLKDRSQKQLFLKANPELDYYFRTFAHQSASGKAALDRKIEAYFALPQGSQARSDYLAAHKDVQVYFDKRSTPAERAMRAMLEVYFDKQGRDRQQYGLQHPEIQAYFDARKTERDNEQAIGEAFAQADPRLARFWELARVDITLAGQMVADELHRRKVHPGGLSIRRDRSA